jgi:hypothetical protein
LADEAFDGFRQVRIELLKKYPCKLFRRVAAYGPPNR